jgi:hypothetical protein
VKIKWKLKEKLKSYLVKQLKTSKRNMKELNDPNKRPNLTIMGIEGK